jgi:hypothetical protein
MKGNKKTVIITVISIFIIIFLVIGYKAIKPKPKVQDVSTYIKKDTSEQSHSTTQSSSVDTTNSKAVDKALGISSTTSSSSSNDDTSSSSDSTQDIDVKAAMQDYLNVDLDDKKLDNRKQILKPLYSDSLYKSLKIDDNTTLLKKMLSDWQTKKIINTNQPIQLLNQSIQELNVYSNMNDANDYLVVATLQLKSPMSPNTSQVIREYSIKTSTGKITELTQKSEVAGKS